MSSPSFKYNPGILGDQELVGSFVVRRRWLELLLESLLENAQSASNRHLLVIGPRGSGKTMLVRRVAAEVRANPELAAHWIPVVFGEESYQVGSAGELWLEALRQLSEQAASNELARTVQELRAERDDARLRERALAHLRDFAASHAKRLLLVVENLNMVCEQIKDDAAWELRHTLLNEPAILLLGTATQRFDTIDDASQAWYELFSLHELRPLDNAETSTLWQARTGEDPGAGPIRAIAILTGGNPRLLTVMASFAAGRSFQELMEQIVHLIDDHTEYFKSHLESLPTRERRVFVTVLEIWSPATAADIAREARMEINEVSALLNRLAARGAVEVDSTKPRRKLYQAAERLYNIYYLMRRRGQPADRVRAAVSFMVTFYGKHGVASKIAELAREACSLGEDQRRDHYLAYEELLKQLSPSIREQAVLASPAAFFDTQSAPESIRKARQEIQQYRDKRLLEGALATRNPAKTLEVGRGILERSPDDLPARSALTMAFLMQGNAAEAESSARALVSLTPDIGHSWGLLGEALMMQGRTEEAVAALGKAILLSPADSTLWHWYGLARSAHGDANEALRAYKSADEIDPSQPGVLRSLSVALDECGQLEAAAQALTRLTVLEPNSSDAWLLLVSVLLRQGKLEQALQPLRRAAELHPVELPADGVLPALVLVAAAYGHAREALKFLSAREAAPTLEPLEVALRLYLGEKPTAPKEILEVAHDIVEKIRKLEPRPTPATPPQSPSPPPAHLPPGPAEN